MLSSSLIQTLCERNAEIHFFGDLHEPYVTIVSEGYKTQTPFVHGLEEESLDMAVESHIIQLRDLGVI